MSPPLRLDWTVFTECLASGALVQKRSLQTVVGPVVVHQPFGSFGEIEICGEAVKGAGQIAPLPSVKAEVFEYPPHL